MASAMILRTSKVQTTCQSITSYIYFARLPIWCANNQLSKGIVYLNRQFHNSVHIRYPDKPVAFSWTWLQAARSRPTIAPGTAAGLGRWGEQKSRSKHSNYRNQDSDDEGSDSDGDDNDGDFGPHYEEDGDFPDNYKEVKKHLTSLRADAILGGGLNMSRKKIDDYFLASKLQLNGIKVLKKSKQMEPGDCIDLITEVTDGTMKIKRVRLVKIAAKKSSKDRHLAYLRAWRANVSVSRPENTKWSPER